MIHVSILYPHCAPTLIHEDTDCRVEFGHEKTLPESYTVQTSTAGEAFCQNLLVLEPAIVEPHAYTEGYRRKFSRVFSFGGPDTGNVTGYRHRLPPLWPELPERPILTSWEERINGVVAVCSNKYSRRYHELSNLASFCQRAGMRFDVFGQVPFDAPWYRGPTDSKIRTLGEYRFAYCSENSEHSHYCTEKLPEALAAGCIPIYAGATPAAYPLFPWKDILSYEEVRSDSQLHSENPIWRRREFEHRKLMPWLSDNWEAIREDMSFSHVARLIALTLG